MATRSRAAFASVLGWLIVALIVVWTFGLVIGWLAFVLRSLAWLALVVVLVMAYLAVKGPADD